MTPEENIQFIKLLEKFDNSLGLDNADIAIKANALLKALNEQ